MSVVQSMLFAVSVTNPCSYILRKRTIKYVFVVFILFHFVLLMANTFQYLALTKKLPLFHLTLSAEHRGSEMIRWLSTKGLAIFSSSLQ